MQSVLTIAGSDSGGGAGIQADLKTFQELKVFGTSVITAITAQNTQAVYSIQPTDVNIVIDQLTAVLQDFDITCIKTGMLYSEEIIAGMAPILTNFHKPLIVDPVMIAKSGDILLNKNAITNFKQYILPITYLITPNIPEIETLTNIKIESEHDIKIATNILREQGTKNVVVKGGHLPKKNLSQDYLSLDGKGYRLSSPRINTQNTHGTGCTFSAAITAFLALGYSLLDAAIEAKKFIQTALQNAISLGHGHGPVNHSAYQRLGQKCEIQIDEW